MHRRFVGLLLVSLLSACAAFEDPSKRATQNAENTALWETVSVADQQAETIVALRSTADTGRIAMNEGTQISQQRDALQATINALNAAGSAPNNNNSPVFGATAQPTPFTSDGAPTAQTQPTPAAAANYVQATTGTTLGPDYCAGNRQVNFTTDDRIIYFVTIAQGIASGVEYSLRVSKDGQVVNTDNGFWVSDDTYNETCIYYGIDRANIDFSVGSYTAELLADQESVAQVTFAITAGSTTDDMSGQPAVQ